MTKGPRLIANFAILLTGAIILSMGVDYLAVWFGYAPFAVCLTLTPVFSISHALAILFVTVGLIVWAATLFTSATGAALTIGGFLLGVIPMVLPHYLGVTCSAIEYQI
jgi:hypothetical protein